MKAQKCKIRLHGSFKEILTGEFPSIAAAKKITVRFIKQKKAVGMARK